MGMMSTWQVFLSESKIRRLNIVVQGSAGNTPPHELLTRPPPLTIPQHHPHHYSSTSQHNSHSANSSSALFSLHAPAFQMPNTPSGSSSTSSPPFSASAIPFE